MPWIPIAAAAVNVIGGAMANQAGRDANAAANAQRESAMDRISRVGLPDIEKEKLNLETLQYLGDLTPEQLQTLSLDPSAMEQINVDPQFKAKQLEALERVGQLSKEGMTPEEKSILEMSRRKAAAESQAKMSQILQERQQRGIGDSGDELAAKLSAAQQGADMQSQTDMQAAQQMMANRRSALEQLSNMAGGLRNQDYSEQSNLAKARDAINQFNVQNAQSVAQTNVSNKNQALDRNLQQRQALANENTALRNQQQQYNKQLIDAAYQREMGKASSMSNALTGQAAATQAAGAAQAGAIANTAQGVGNIISAFGSKK